jgi:hypothetical protein
MVSIRSNRSGTVAIAGDGKADKVIPQVSTTASNRTGRATKASYLESQPAHCGPPKRPPDEQRTRVPEWRPLVRQTAGAWPAFWDDVAGRLPHPPLGAVMAGQFEATVEIDRPVAEVFAFLADGTNDPKFSPRVLRIDKNPAGPTAVGTVFTSTVKDAGMKTGREFKITELVDNSKIRWAEQSKNLITAVEGGYDLEAISDTRTRVRIFNLLEGHGFGKIIAGFALSMARKDAPAFGNRIKAAIEAS